MKVIKTNSFKHKIIKLIRELLIVFIGVFAAFLLNDYWNDQVKKEETKSTYSIIYEDLNRYYISGNTSRKDGFINLFKSLVKNSELVIKNKEIPKDFEIYGDYWNIELINSMLLSGKLNDIDSQTFIKVSRFHTVHKNMLNYIDKHNKFYDEEVVPNLDKGKSEFYDEQTGQLKQKYQRLIEYQEIILSISQSTVEMAKEMKNNIKSKHL